MKIEVILFNTIGEACDEAVLDIGDGIDLRDPPDWPCEVGNKEEQRVSEHIHAAIKDWLLFPGFHISIAPAAEEGNS
jgi:hypothetical protein